MKRLFLATAVLSLTACSNVPAPLKYVALQMPTKPINTTPPKAYEEVEDHKIGFWYRKPQNVALMVKELQEKTHTDILRDADVRIRVPLCIEFCYAYDTASTGKEPE